MTTCHCVRLLFNKDMMQAVGTNDHDPQEAQQPMTPDAAFRPGKDSFMTASNSQTCHGGHHLQRRLQLQRKLQKHQRSLWDGGFMTCSTLTWQENQNVFNHGVPGMFKDL